MAKDDYLKMVEGSPNAWVGMPPLVKQIKDDAQSVLGNCLDEMFSSCDDLFFDLSSRAASNNEQNLYFESMRELRVRKNGVINKFRQHVDQCFLALAGAPVPFGKPAGTEPGSPDGLALVQNDDLEQEVALTGMIGKARVNSQEPLYHLSTRFDYMISQVRVNADNNPLDPQQICQSFARACDLLEINIKARIIIYKQFDRHVIGKLAKIYASANELLINAGVLPKITGSIKNPETGRRRSAAAAAADEALLGEQESADAGLFQFNFNELSNLLASMRRLGLTQLPNYNQYTANPGPVMSSGELLDLLGALQSRPQYRDYADDAPVTLRQVINTILSAQNTREPHALQQPDEDVINLVAMFFDFVLDDPNLPVLIQALISRLQIPILKVALRDKNFFSSSGHPARKLVNAIAAASIGWDETEQPARDKLYERIAAIVQTINEQYVDNHQVFSEKLAELQAFAEQEKRKSSLVEKRTSQSVEGQARTNVARVAAQQLMFEKLEREELPESINEFLVAQWLQLLVLTHLKNGEESAEWLEAGQLVDDLVWACTPHQDARSRQRLEKIKPDLLTRISNGLARVTETAEDCIATVRDIDRVISHLQQGDDVPRRAITAAQAVALGHTPGGGSKSWKEMTALERQQARYKALTYEFIKQAESLPIGTWVSYEDSQQGKIMRCKLAARIEATDSYVFVNRFGFKALEKPRKDFAYDMQQGRAVPLSSGALFDRAMSNIISNIRDVARPEQPA